MLLGDPLNFNCGSILEGFASHDFDFGTQEDLLDTFLRRAPRHSKRRLHLLNRRCFPYDQAQYRNQYGKMG
mgnify:CR=1 FL=1